MKQRVLPNSDIRVSQVGFGAASLHHLFSARARQRLLHAAADAGVTHFDTAPYYGYGLAEQDLGIFLHGRRARFTVATKVGLYPAGPPARGAGQVWLRKGLGKLSPAAALPVADWNVNRARASLEASLRRLRTDYVDFLFLHEPELAQLPAEALASWLREERARGRVRAWGLAGEAECVAPFVSAGSELASIVQTRDSLDRREADFLRAAGRDLQFTYGYYRSSAPPPDLQDVLARNAAGTVLIATRHEQRLAELGALSA